MPNYYPIMLDVRGRPVTVVGGNAVAAEKAASLAASGARVTVQAPEFCSELQALAGAGHLTLREKRYEPGDLEGAWLVVAAVTYEPDLVEAIWAETQQGGQLVNIVDVPARCSFIVPSILRRGQLTIAVSTEGASPSLAKRIRQRLEALFPPAYDAYLRLASVARTHLRAHGVSYAGRDEFFARYEASSTLAQLEAGDAPKAAQITAHLLHDFAIDVPPRTLEEAVRSHADV
jgi:precorrin-2 dehydrogenase / sirohydrochlorin ferrochelatase